MHGRSHHATRAGKAKEACRGIDGAVKAMWSAAAPNTLFVLAALGGNTAYARYAYEVKCKRQAALPGLPPWTLACEEHLAACTASAAQGCLWLAVK